MKTGLRDQFLATPTERQGSRLAALGTTVVGDDLYCHEPFCRALLDKRFEFILMTWNEMVSSKQWHANAGLASGTK